MFVESFSIGFNDFKTDKANLFISWENTVVKVPLIMESKKEVLASIDKTLSSKEAKGSDYFQAAAYYLESGMDLKKSLEYVRKANQLQPDVFYMLKLQSEVEAANGLKKRQSLQLKNLLNFLLKQTMVITLK